jgi:PPK2 family polyphosphate:nucleotide phosphotransferase
VRDDRLMSMRDVLRVPAQGRVDLASIDPAGTPGLPGKQAGRRPKRWARERLDAVGTELASHQERLYASAKVGGCDQRLLLILQAMDCGGKDGTTRKVAGTMNPQGLRIVSFGPPTEEERAHDFLWRIRRGLPMAGYVGVFNRSQYEDVLVVRVHNLVPPATWQARYEQINAFERELADTGTTIVKVMLHISFEEQRERLMQRLDDPTKHWKYNPADVDERGYWAAYQRAYEDVLSRCSTGYAPWYVVPADRKWYRDWAVATLLHETFTEMGLRYPAAAFDVTVERQRLAQSDNPASKMNRK